NIRVRRCLFFSMVPQFYTVPSEQGFNKDITNPVLSKQTQLKIPDVCRYKNIPCSNWLDVFTHLGMRF
ncbi:MAG: hypothetical protein ACTH5O_09705, partial [Psychrobacter sp.]